MKRHRSQLAQRETHSVAAASQPRSTTSDGRTEPPLSPVRQALAEKRGPASSVVAQ